MSEQNDTRAAPAHSVGERKSFVQRLISIKPSDLVALFFMCVLAGLVLAAFQIDPARLWVDFFGTLADAWERFFEIIGDSFRWAIQYFFLGAVLVIPIWLVWRLIKASR